MKPAFQIRICLMEGCAFPGCNECRIKHEDEAHAPADFLGKEEAEAYVLKTTSKDEEATGGHSKDDLIKQLAQTLRSRDLKVDKLNELVTEHVALEERVEALEDELAEMKVNKNILAICEDATPVMAQAAMEKILGDQLATAVEDTIGRHLPPAIKHYVEAVWEANKDKIDTNPKVEAGPAPGTRRK